MSIEEKFNQAKGSVKEGSSDIWSDAAIVQGIQP